MNTPLPCLGDFYAVRPRRQIVYPPGLVRGEKGPQNRILSCPLDDPPPAVYHISRNLIMEPKIVLNARIVVVGASSTSLAFLERLAFSWVSFVGIPTSLAIECWPITYGEHEYIQCEWKTAIFFLSFSSFSAITLNCGKVFSLFAALAKTVTTVDLNQALLLDFLVNKGSHSLTLPTPCCASKVIPSFQVPHSFQ